MENAKVGNRETSDVRRETGKQRPGVRDQRSEKSKKPTGKRGSGEAEVQNSGGSPKEGNGKTGKPINGDRRAPAEHGPLPLFPKPRVGSMLVGGREHGQPLGLTGDQQKAVRDHHGPVVVAAGPGTGKTLVLTCRVSYLIRERSINPRSMNVVTFTNKAAEDMLRRFRDMLPKAEDLRDLRVGTFHGFSLDLIRREWGKDRRVLIDQVESRSLIETVIREGKFRVRLGDACDFISRTKGDGTMKAAIEGSFEFGRILKDYQNRLRTLRLWDFDDILLEAVALLESDRSILKRLEAGHLLVDEFQDVNAVQYRLVRLLAGEGQNLFVIGDPDQAIYGFRGGDRRFFTKLLGDFSGAHLIRLESNHRSTGNILDAAHEVIAEDSDRIDLRVTPSRDPGVRVRLLQLESELSEGIAVVQEILERIGGTDLTRAGEAERSFRDFAVLFRTGRQADVLEMCLKKEGLPHRIIGQKGFMDSEGVRDVLTLARCLTPSDEDYRIQCALRLGLFDPGEGVWKNILARQAEKGGSLYETLQALSGDFDKVREFIDAVERCRSLVETARADDVIRACCEGCGVSDEINLERLLNVCSRYDTFEGFYRDVLLGKDADCEQEGKRTGNRGEAITLMTLHAAKGLEFPVVFIVGAEDGLIPFRERDADLSEERRLLYVGLTRARDEVILTAVKRRIRYGKRIKPEISPFLKDLCGSKIEVEERVHSGSAQISLF